MDKYTNAGVVFSKFSRDYMELRRDLPIRASEMGVLNIISHRDGDFTPLALAEMTRVSKPMIAAHIGALLKKGYIRKEASGVDKRSFYVRPTEKGKALADESLKRQTEYLKMIEAKLGKPKFDELVVLLNETQTVLDEMKIHCNARGDNN